MKRSPLTLASLVAVLAITLTACGEVDGTVTGKEHQDAYSTTTLTKVGKTFVPITTRHPECWQVTVSGKESGSDCVDEDTYDSLAVGDHYSNTES